MQNVATLYENEHAAIDQLTRTMYQWTCNLCPAQGMERREWAAGARAGEHLAVRHGIRWPERRIGWSK